MLITNLLSSLVLVLIFLGFASACRLLVFWFLIINSLFKYDAPLDKERLMTVLETGVLKRPPDYSLTNRLMNVLSGIYEMFACLFELFTWLAAYCAPPFLDSPHGWLPALLRWYSPHGWLPTVLRHLVLSTWLAPYCSPPFGTPHGWHPTVHRHFGTLHWVGRLLCSAIFFFLS